LKQQKRSTYDKGSVPPKNVPPERAAKACGYTHGGAKSHGWGLLQNVEVKTVIINPEVKGIGTKVTKVTKDETCDALVNKVNIVTMPLQRRRGNQQHRD
jgi:hypothetical protein